MSTSFSISPAIVVLVGPTASGKTALLDAIFGTRRARESYGLPEAEVVSADSMQAYRGMDIGTAKPDEGLRFRLPHSLLDIRGIEEQYSAGDFVRLAEEACLRIAAAGKLPILSGGTGFYVRNFICGLPTGPTADPRLREEVARDLAEKGAAALRAELAGIDPRSAERIHGNDFYRLTRAIEITRLTGRPMADFAAPLAPRSLFRFAIIGIERPRKELAARIGERVDAMMAAGLAEEASALRRLGYGPDAPGMKAIGYREFFEPPSEGLASGEMRGGGSDLAKVAEAIKVDTRHYAKRQMTFFRSLPGIEWIGPDADALASRLRSIVQAPSSAL